MKKTWIAIAAFTLLSVSVIAFEMTNNEPKSQNEVTETVDFTVYRSATCGCCGKWIDHIEANKFSVGVRHPVNMSVIKSEHGIAPKLQSCHTACATERGVRARTLDGEGQPVRGRPPT